MAEAVPTLVLCRHPDRNLLSFLRLFALGGGEAAGPCRALSRRGGGWRPGWLWGGQGENSNGQVVLLGTGHTEPFANSDTNTLERSKSLATGPDAIHPPPQFHAVAPSQPRGESHGPNPYLWKDKFSQHADSRQISIGGGAAVSLGHRLTQNPSPHLPLHLSLSLH